MRPMELAATFTAEDDAFVATLEVEEVYIGECPTHASVPSACQTEFAAMVAELMGACHTAAEACRSIGTESAADSLRAAWRRLHVALAITLRPIGAQRNPSRVVAERLGALA